MPEVILIDPDSGMPNTRPQLGTLHLAAMLKRHGVDVEIIDLSVRKDGLERLVHAISSATIFVGVSVVIGPMLRSGIAASRVVRETRPGLPVIWGGVHPTTEPQSTLAHEAVDAICMGEGELAVLEIYQALKNGQDFAEIQGVGYKENGDLVFTTKRETYFNMDDLPPLPYELVDLSQYRRSRKAYDFFGLQGEQLMSIESSRGCVFRCTYCVNAARRERFRTMSAQQVVAHIEDIVRAGSRSITFNDDNFFVDKQRALEILEEIIRRNWNLELFIAVRSDFLARIDDDFYSLMKRAGVAMLGIGVESGSDRTLRRIRKKESIADTFEASRRLAKHGIRAWYHFIFGFPGESLEDFLETYKAMYLIASTNPYAQVNLNQLIPNPGTPSFQECLEAGWKASSTLEGWADIMIHTRRLGRPAYVDQALFAWYEEHLKHWRFPNAEMPLVSGVWADAELQGLKSPISLEAV